MASYKQQEAQLWANMGDSIASTLSMYLSQNAQNQLKTRESMDMAKSV